MVNKGEGYIDCAQCKQSYHTLCVNISNVELLKMSATDKRLWECPGCVCKRPKGNNKDSPLRGERGPSAGHSDTGGSAGASVTTLAATAAAASQSSNVTVRPSKVPPQPSRHNQAGDSVSRSEIRKIINDIMQECTQNITKQLNEIHADITSFKESLTFFNEHFEKMKDEINTQKSDMRILKEENSSLRTEVNKLAARVNQMDQISRAANLELQCVPEHKTENVVKIVEQLGRTINCPVTKGDISHCTRIAKMNQQSSRPRSILIRLGSPQLRDKFLAAAIEYNKKNPRDKLNASHLGLSDEQKSAIYLVENLSPENKALHAAARVRGRELNYKFVWVRGGRVFMRKTDTTEYVCVRNVDMLRDLV